MRGHKAVCLVIASFIVSAVFAQERSDVHVRAFTFRPGCDFQEAGIEIWNESTRWHYRLEVEGTYDNGAGPASCTRRCVGGSNAGNACLSSSQCPDGTCPSATACAKTFLEEKMLAPCGETLEDYCGAVTTQGGFLFPVCPQCSDAHPNFVSCDNITPGNEDLPYCPNGCDDGWCADFGILRVRILQYSDDGTNWTNWSSGCDTVCVRGGWVGCAAPTCSEETVCDTEEVALACDGESYRCEE